MIFFFFHSKLHRPDIYWPDQPASFQCYQLQCCCCCSCSGGQQLQQLSNICQQPGTGLQHCYQADLRPHESDSQVQPFSLLTVPCCCKAHLPGCSQPAGKIHCCPVMIKIDSYTAPRHQETDFWMYQQCICCVSKHKTPTLICLEKMVTTIWQ